ncbi:hypothetical protein ACL02S_16945 [Nocardia sp. 004]|uniref:hypothetical protein n=1 Tax=Nocardia sp. 004 TaxID=3385978 RepID=UPI0039A2CA03
MSGDDGKIESPLLAWPSEWGKERLPGKLLFFLGVLGVIIILLIPEAIDHADSGDLSGAVFLVVGGVGMLALFAPVARNIRVRRSGLPHDIDARCRDGDRMGLRIKTEAYWKPVFLIWLVASAVFLVYHGFLLVTRLSDEDVSGWSDVTIGGLVAVPVALGAIVFLFYYLLWGNRRREFVFLSGDGISQESGRSRKYISWADIAGVSPLIVNSSHVVRIIPVSDINIRVDTSERFIDRLQRGQLERSMDFYPWTLNVDPALFLHLVRFYWRHPDARHELGTDAAIGRIRRGALFD